MEIVESEKKRGPRLVVQQCLEPVADENIEIRKRLGGQSREDVARCVGQFGKRLRQGAEEDDRIGVRLVHAIPEGVPVPRGALPRIEPACDQRGFAGSGRCRNPCDPARRRLFDLAKQTLACNQAAQLGRDELVRKWCRQRIGHQGNDRPFRITRSHQDHSRIDHSWTAGALAGRLRMRPPGG